MSDRIGPLYSHHTEGTLQLFEGLGIICPLPGQLTLLASYDPPGLLHGNSCPAHCTGPPGSRGHFSGLGELQSTPPTPFLFLQALGIPPWGLSLCSFPLPSPFLAKSSTFSVQADGGRCHSFVDLPGLPWAEACLSHIGCKESLCHYYSIYCTSLLFK